MEEWRPIEGFPDYAVSDAGRVMRTRDAFRGDAKAGRVLTPRRDRDGYLELNLTPLIGGSTRVKVHRLVAIVFLGEHPKKPSVNHLNGVKDDNRTNNLEWCNTGENNAHAAALGLVPHGERHHMTKLPTAKIPELIAARDEGLTLKAVGARFGLSAQQVLNICRGSSRRMG